MTNNKQYSKIYKTEDGKQMRYNYKNSTLEYITFTSLEFDENDNLITVQLEDAHVIDSIGLNVEDWNENKNYWIEKYSEEINEELFYLTKDLEMEFL